MHEWAATAPAHWGIDPDAMLGEPTGGRLPMAGSINPKSGPTWIVIGDAAGSINPFNGEGIDYAYETGRMAAELIDEALEIGSAMPLARYPDLLEAEYGLYFRVARAFAHIIGQPALMQQLTRVGMQSQTLMEWVLRIMANLLRPDELGPAEAAYKAVADDRPRRAGARARVAMAVGGRSPDRGAAFVSTGQLPGREAVRHHLEAAYERHRSVDDGQVADYIPALAQAPRRTPSAPASPASTARRSRWATPPPRSPSRACPSRSCSRSSASRSAPHRAGELLGTNATGLPFDSVMAVELNDSRTMNPLVNAGAIATTSLLPGSTVEDKWAHVLDGLSGFAGRPLSLDQAVYESEAATNLRNRGIAHLLESYGSITLRPRRRHRGVHPAVLAARSPPRTSP